MTYTQYNAKNWIDYNRYSIYRRNVGVNGFHNALLESLICDWYIKGHFMVKEAPHAVDGLAEKFRRLAIREAEKAGYALTEKYIIKNDARKAWEVFFKERDARYEASRKASRKRAK